MKWKKRQRSRNVQDRRGKAGKKTVGGGLAFLGIALIVSFMGGDPAPFLQEGINRTLHSTVSSKSKIPQSKQDELVEFVSVVLAETEQTWHDQFTRQNMKYVEPTLVFFAGAVTSACGSAQSAMGPFYCPVDQTIYIDLDFFYELEKSHDAPGDFAQAYVIAHEVGHHVQKVIGVLDKVAKQKRRLNQTDANKVSVKTELMADCFAGVWASSAKSKGLLEQGDIAEALNAATQIGDDRLQQKGRGHVVPDSFTHGTGQQRYDAFNQGLSSGHMKACL